MWFGFLSSSKAGQDFSQKQTMVTPLSLTQKAQLSLCTWLLRPLFLRLVDLDVLLKAEPAGGREKQTGTSALQAKQEALLEALAAVWSHAPDQRGGGRRGKSVCGSVSMRNTQEEPRLLGLEGHL